MPGSLSRYQSPSFVKGECPAQDERNTSCLSPPTDINNNQVIGGAVGIEQLDP